MAALLERPEDGVEECRGQRKDQGELLAVCRAFKGDEPIAQWGRLGGFRPAPLLEGPVAPDQSPSGPHFRKKAVIIRDQ